MLSEAEAKRLAANKENNEHIRKASGEVDDDRPLVSFLYILARDHVPIGVIEQIIVDQLIVAEPGAAFTNGWIANWAKDLADRLVPCPPTSSS